MVQYTCSKCGKIFDKKQNYESHMKRKTPCNKRNTKGVKCEYCGKIISRKDHLTRHYNSCKKYQITINNTNKETNKKTNKNSNNNTATNRGNIKGNLNNGNNSTYNQNIIINYNVSAFGKEGIDSLTAEDKLQILSSNGSPIETLTEKTNLNPNLAKYHNVGYPDNKSGSGIIYDGNKWRTEKIGVIVDEILHTKGNDVEAICEEMKNYVIQEKLSQIDKILEEIHQIKRPENKLDHSNRKFTKQNLKVSLHNNKDLAINSKKKFDELAKKEQQFDLNKDTRTDYSKMLKEGITLESIDRLNQIKKEKIDTLKKIIDYLVGILQKTNDDPEKITEIKNSVKNDPEELNNLINCLTRYIYLNEPLDTTQKLTPSDDVPEFLSQNNKIALLKTLIHRVLDDLTQ